MSADLEQEILIILRERMSRADRVTALAELIYEFGDPVVYGVEPRRTSVQVEQVEVYGLLIGLDANGDACRIDFPYGAEVDRGA